jgi:hypothetical protein
MSMSRRTMLADILPGAAVTVAGLTVIGWVITPGTADAIQIAVPTINKTETDELVQTAQAVVVGPRRRRRGRRWICWWHRGRRVCGWR